jgi:signal transduction histidine kinase
MLQEFIELNREIIITRCRAKVAARSIPEPSADEIDHGVPLFLDQLVTALRSGGTSGTMEIDNTAGKHGHDLRLKGFTISQVVHDYGDVCQTITELAGETNAPISVEDFRTLNCCLDNAIASAVTVYGRESQQPAEGQAEQKNQRMNFFAHELRNLVHTATVAFDVLKTGNVGVSGSTGTVLNRSLTGLRELIARSLAEVRLTEGIQNPERIVVADFIRERAATASLEANSRNIKLVVPPVDPAIEIEADRQVVAAVVGNLLQNAFKFTRPRTTVTLRVEADADRVLIEVQDECGGLLGIGHRDRDRNQVFRPFEQRSTDRTGLGIGLAFSRWGTEANNGRLYSRNLPNDGCVFTVDLPRVLLTVPTA